ERPERLGLARPPVAEERPDTGSGRIEQAAVLEVAVVAGLVDRADRAEPHRDRRELPEIRHQPRMRVRAQALTRDGLAAEVVELVLGQTALEERPRVDAGRRVALVEDLVSGVAVVLAPEEVVEAELVEGRRRPL